MKYVSVQDLVEQNRVVIKTGPFGTQLKASEYVSFGTPVLNVRNLGFATVNTDKLEMVSDGTLERLSAHKLVTGDIVFGRKGAVERHAFISESENGWMQGSDCIRLRVLADSVNPRFLSYYFLTKRHRAFMMSMCSHGTTMASLNQKIIEKIIVPLPERSIQDKVVEILATLDKQIATNQKINDNLEQQISALYESWFENFDLTNGVCPESWNNQELSTITEISNGKRPPIKAESCSKETPIPIVGAASVMGFTSEANHTDKILVTGRVGTHGIVQRFNTPCWTSDNTLVIKSSYYEFTNQILQRIDYSAMNRGSTQPLITQGDMKKVSILLPDVETLAKFETFAGTMMNQWEANKQENVKLASLRDTLLPKLMSGELDVSGIQL